MPKPSDESGRPVPPIGTNYPAFQLARALRTAETHPDESTRERAQTKADRWIAALLGKISGRVDVGSRAPVTGVPAWATLEVMTGGFATGNVLSGGPLLEHEKLLLRELALNGEEAVAARAALNAFFVTEPGLVRLQDWLENGKYDIQVPEEGALLAIACLLKGGHSPAARGLLDEIAPHFSAMRFYPVPSAKARPSSGHIWVEAAGDAARKLNHRPANKRIEAQREAIEVWAPFYDHIVALFLQTVKGDAPVAKRTEEGGWLVDGRSGHVIEGGWPCAVYPDTWFDRARQALDEFERLRERHRACSRPDRRNESMGLMLDALRRCVVAPADLSARDVGRVRATLARYVAKHGMPGSERHLAQRGVQWAHATAPTHQAIARVVAARLQDLPPDAGLDDISVLVQPIQAGECATGACPSGTAVPSPIVARVARCQADTPQRLVERKIVTSAEMLALLLPQVTSATKAQGFGDSAASGLYASIYRAFRQRRSLLLLNLQKQVQFNELPWVAALERLRTRDLSNREAAAQALVSITKVAISGFPQTILPNKMLQEMHALARDAEIDLPLTEEVAADIFMGEFSPKFSDAARRALRRIAGSVYAKYYGIDAEDCLAALPFDSTPAVGQRQHGDALAALCAQRAGVSLQGWRAAKNGQIIEQQHIVTTHNLATLFETVELRDTFGARLDDMAKTCFRYAIRQLQLKTSSRHARLIQTKKAAYAWRQMVFFLAESPIDAREVFDSWAQKELVRQPQQFRTRFQPVFDRLTWAMSEPGSSQAVEPPMIFLGWSSGHHLHT